MASVYLPKRRQVWMMQFYQHGSVRVRRSSNTTSRARALALARAMEERYRSRALPVTRRGQWRLIRAKCQRAGVSVHAIAFELLVRWSAHE